MPRFTRLGPGDRFRALVGAQVSQDPSRTDTALKTGLDIVGDPQGLARKQIKNEYETFRMLADDPVKLKAYANEVLDRAARSSGLTVAELKSSVADAMRAGLDAAEIVPPEAMRAAREVEGIDAELLAEALAELDALVGLEPIKAFVHKLVEDATWDALVGKNAEKIDDPFGDGPEDDSGALRHLRIAGNPGAGKTTAVEVLGKVYKALGKVTKGHVHKVEAKDLIAEYLGQTVAKTTAAFEKARGGIFFIDDIQTILPKGSSGNGDQYNKEALDTLLGFAMEHDVLIAIATYPDRMDDFVSYDPGFKSRFPTEVEFPDFPPGQLTEIFERLCHSHKIDYSADTLDKVDKLFHGLKLTRNFGNARLVGNCFEDWRQNQRTRVLAARDGENPPTGVEVKTLQPEDVTEPSGGDVVTIGGGGLRTRADIHAALDGCVVGHDQAKAALSDAVFERMHLRAAGKGTQKPVGFHFFAGPSGVGKTEIAKGLASTCYGNNLEVIDCSKLTSLAAVEAMVHGRLSALDGKSCVVLLDEVEKAHPALFTHLLRVADEGKLMQASGDADLSSCHFLMTSNLGNPDGIFDDVDPRSEIGEYADPKNVETDFSALFDKALPAEFKGRLSEDPIVFRPLGQGALDQILDGTLEKLVQVQARAYDRSVEVAPDLRKRLVELGHDPRLGARPMERVVRRHVLLPFLEAMVSDADKHPPGHVLRFSLGKDEAPKLASKADPALVAAAKERKKAEADAETALSRALALETLVGLVEQDEPLPAELVKQLSRLHAALPKAVETMGFDAGFASLIKEVVDRPRTGPLEAAAEVAVSSQRLSLTKRWPISFARHVAHVLYDRRGEVDWAEAAETLEVAVQACGRRLDPEFVAAKAELAREIAAIEGGAEDDAEAVVDRFTTAIARAEALYSLQREQDAWLGGDWAVMQRELKELAVNSPTDADARRLNDGLTGAIDSGDYEDIGYIAVQPAAELAVKWLASKAPPTFEVQRADVREAFRVQLKALGAGQARDQALLTTWALRTIDALIGDDDAHAALRDEIAEPIKDSQHRNYPRRFLETAAAAAAALELSPVETAALTAAAQAATARHDFEPHGRYNDAERAYEAMEAVAAARPRGDVQAKLLRRLAKLSTAPGAEEDGRAEVVQDIALDIATCVGPGGLVDATLLANRLRDLTTARADTIEAELGTECYVTVLQGLLDAAKLIYPKGDDAGDWAKKTGARLARKSMDEKAEIFREVFRAPEPE